MSPGIARIDPSAWRSGPWANGGGTTHTIATWPGDAGPPRARLSVADIERPGPFSAFPGHDRWLAVLDDGGGLWLDRDRVAHLLTAGTWFAFSGEDVVAAAPTAPARVFNLIVRRGVPWEAAVVTAADERTARPGVVAVFAAAGDLEIALDGRALTLARHVTVLATSAAPQAVRVAASPARPALVLWLG